MVRSSVFLVGLLLTGVLLTANSHDNLSAAANPARLDVSKVPKCGLIGTWRGTVSIPDGADGVSTILSLRFSQSDHKVTMMGTANNKLLAITNEMATCTGFSFITPQGDVSVAFSGKLSDDGESVSGTAKRQDLSASWILQRQ
jgi:hypothetical protein